MRKARFLLFIFLLSLFSGGVFLSAQAWGDPDGIPHEPEWEWTMPDLYSRGDQTFTISVGMIFPVLFINYENPRQIIDNNFNIPGGGALGISYNHFLSPNFFVGGEVSFNWNSTLARHMVFIVPVGLRAGWQFLFGRFEFPVSLVSGLAFHSYLRTNYTGFFARAAAGAFFRFNPDWSFGLNTEWSWYPQWVRSGGVLNRTESVNGNIIGVTLSARYHF